MSFRRMTGEIFGDSRGGRVAFVSVMTVLTIAIAASTLVLAVVDGTALRPLSFGTPDRLVFVAGRSRVGGTIGPASPLDYMLWRERSTTVDGVAAGFFGTAVLGVAGVRGAQSLLIGNVTTNFFDVLEVRPARGRLFLARDAIPGAAPTIILSHDAWARAFASDPEIVGKKIDSGNGPQEVIGVLPRDVSYPMKGHSTDVFTPRPLPRVPYDGSTNFLDVVARLKEGVTAAQAQAEMSVIAPATVTPLHAYVLGSARTWLMLSLTAVAFVLLVAFLTAATIMVTRAIATARDIATREALGASRARLVIGRVASGVALAFGSTIGGLLLARAGLTYAMAVLPADLALMSRIHIDGRVVGTVAVIGVIVGGTLLSTPGWLVWRQSSSAVLASSGSSVIGDRRHSRWLGALQIGCLATAYMLAVASGLVVSSALHILGADLGFDWHHVFVVHYQRELPGVSPAEQIAIEDSVRHELLSRIQHLPGVVSAAVMASGSVPLMGPGGVRYSISIDGVDRDGPGRVLMVNVVTPEYFQTMQMRIVSGRGFLPSDQRGSTPVLILNDVGATRLFGEQSPLGHIASFRGERAIVGVVQGLRYDGPETAPLPELYIPVSQDPVQPRMSAVGTLVVRAENPQAVSRAVVDAIGAVATTGDTQVRFLDDAFGSLTTVQRYVARMLSFFGLVALIAAGVGIYSSMSLYVAQQTRAIGLRIALGATPGRIMQMVFRKALVLTAVGATLGLVGLGLLSRALGSLLTGVRAVNPGVDLAVLAALAMVTLLGALHPARGAATRDPLQTLRQ